MDISPNPARRRKLIKAIQKGCKEAVKYVSSSLGETLAFTIKPGADKNLSRVAFGSGIRSAVLDRLGKNPSVKIADMDESEGVHGRIQPPTRGNGISRKRCAMKDPTAEA